MSKGLLLLKEAVWNNAVWCDLMVRSHGCTTHFSPELWLGRGQAPPFYPNAITLTPDGVQTQLARIATAVAQSPSAPFGVKDSFAHLDLSGLGFEVLFSASWIGLAQGQDLRRGSALEIDWHVVTTPAGLARWERAWRGEGGEEEAPLFLPRLLAEPEVRVLAGLRNGAVVAGLIANRSGQVVGISNVFAAAEESSSLVAAGLGAAGRLWRERPLVGYESGPDLALMLELGFSQLGPLRVWGKA